MASYTMELRACLEKWSQDESLPVREVIEKGREKLFDFPYPLFDPEYKKVFETHFIRKFYMREIGFETEGLFKFNLETWLIINMPYFNKLFESELLQYDPLANQKVEVKQTKKRDRDQTVDSTSEGSSTSSNEQDTNGTLNEDNFDRRLESDNPDSRLAITTEDGKGVIEYAKNIKEDSENNVKTSSSQTKTDSNDASQVKGNTVAAINELEEYVETRIGKTGDKSFSKMVEEYRGALLRVENKIFNEMQELFMLVY